MKIVKKPILEKLIFLRIKEHITDEYLFELEKIKQYCENNKWNFNNFCPLLVKMVKEKVELPWLERIIKSKLKFKNDSASLESYQNRYGMSIRNGSLETKNRKNHYNKTKILKKPLTRRVGRTL